MTATLDAPTSGITAALLPLLAGDLDAPLAWRRGRPITRRQFIADVAALAARLPAEGAALQLATDRYRFAVGFGAAMVRGHPSLLPPNRVPDTIERLRALYPNAYAIADAGAEAVELPLVRQAEGHAPLAPHGEIPRVPADRVVAQVLTSGSTGAPVPHAKPWGRLVASARAEAARLAEAMGRATVEGVALVATVPPQHMYGFESSVLLALAAGAAFDVERPFYPADIAAALERLPRPRLFVTAPFHLKTLLESGIALPPCDLVLCATAPLAPQLAARAEAAFAAPLIEIYGCTEAGQVATRRTVAGPEWHVFEGLRLEGDGARTRVDGGHVPQPTALADVLETFGTERFRLLGRSNDLVNVAGKRSSLAHLDFHLNAVEGVLDGAFWVPPAMADDDSVVRLVAFVVAPGLSAGAIRAALRERIDAAFLPRRIVHVPALPRDPTGKLPAGRLAALAERRPAAACSSDDACSRPTP
jgi:acyl-coenzyme A synthetase/AMP-(fatty) acid ligase